MRHIKQFGMVVSAAEIQGPNTAEEQKLSKKEKVLARTSCGKSEWTLCWPADFLCFGAEETAFGDDYLKEKGELQYGEDMGRKLTLEIVSIYVKKNSAKELSRGASRW